MAFPATDLIANAPDVSSHGSVSTGTASWDNTGATFNDSTESMLSGFNYRVWHKAYISSSGSCMFQDDTSGPYADTFMYLYRGPEDATNGSAFTFLSSADDNAGNGRPRITYMSPGDEWLYIAHTGYSNGRYANQTMIFSIPALSLVARGRTTVTVDGYIVPAFSATIDGRASFADTGLTYFATLPFQGTVGAAVSQYFSLTARVLSSQTVDVHKRYEDEPQPIIHFV